MEASITASELKSALTGPQPPLVIDVRRPPVMYDSLYRWCKEGQDEVHTWNPDAYR